MASSYCVAPFSASGFDNITTNNITILNDYTSFTNSDISKSYFGATEINSLDWLLSYLYDHNNIIMEVLEKVKEFKDLVKEEDFFISHEQDIRCFNWYNEIRNTKIYNEFFSTIRKIDDKYVKATILFVFIQLNKLIFYEEDFILDCLDDKDIMVVDYAITACSLINNKTKKAKLKTKKYEDKFLNARIEKLIKLGLL